MPLKGSLTTDAKMGRFQDNLEDHEESVSSPMRQNRRRSALDPFSASTAPIRCRGAEGASGSVIIIAESDIDVEIVHRRGRWQHGWQRLWAHHRRD